MISRVTFWGVDDGQSWLNGLAYSRAHQLSIIV